MSREDLVNGLKTEPATLKTDMHVEMLNLEENEITESKLAEVLKDLFYKVRSLSNNSKFSQELQDKFCDLLDGGGGVQMLMSELKGGWYELDQETREYIKQPPQPASEVYPKVNQLISTINSLIDSGLQPKGDEVKDKTDTEGR